MKKFRSLLLILLALLATDSYAQRGMLYPNFPEGFEMKNQVLDRGYAEKSIYFPTGKWCLSGALVDSTRNDNPSNGFYAVRLNRNNTEPCYLAMDFDVKKGASRILVWYSSYSAKVDKPATFRLEYSTDGGNSWIQTGEDIVAKLKSKQSANFMLDIKGTVRFRIHKLALGNGDEDATIANGRLSIDDFAVYQN